MKESQGYCDELQNADNRRMWFSGIASHDWYKSSIKIVSLFNRILLILLSGKKWSVISSLYTVNNYIRNIYAQLSEASFCSAIFAALTVCCIWQSKPHALFLESESTKSVTALGYHRCFVISLQEFTVSATQNDEFSREIQGVLRSDQEKAREGWPVRYIIYPYVHDYQIDRSM